MEESLTLADLGWRASFQAQLTLDEFVDAEPMRVVAVHRGALELLGERGGLRVASDMVVSRDPSERPTVGDWLLASRGDGRSGRLLQRNSLIKRRAAGIESRMQAIAANIDTLLIVTSMNTDFNPARLERYLALAFDSGAQPVIVLTKADQVGLDERRDCEAQAGALSPGLMVVALDARDEVAVAGSGGMDG